MLHICDRAHILIKACPVYARSQSEAVTDFLSPRNIQWLADVEEEANEDDEVPLSFHVGLVLMDDNNTLWTVHIINRTANNVSVEREDGDIIEGCVGISTHETSARI